MFTQKKTAKKKQELQFSSQLSLPSTKNLTPCPKIRGDTFDLSSLLHTSRFGISLPGNHGGKPRGFSIFNIPMTSLHTKWLQPVLPLCGERKWRPWKRKEAYRQESFTWSRDVHVSCSHHTILFGRLILTSAPQEIDFPKTKKLKYQLKSKYAISIGQFHMMVIWRRVSTMQKHCGSLCTVNASALSINYYQWLSMTIDFQQHCVQQPSRCGCPDGGRQLFLGV